jgi:hypothetical protein
MGTTAIITVTATVDEDMLEPDDRTVAGTYGVIMGDGVGEHPETPRGPVDEGDDPIVEAALDVLHGTIAIAVLDDFDVDVRILPSDGARPDKVMWL